SSIEMFFCNLASFSVSPIFTLATRPSSPVYFVNLSIVSSVFFNCQGKHSRPLRIPQKKPTEDNKIERFQRFFFFLNSWFIARFLL
ncbi:hypothetical protein, partial [Enterococcus faecium]|uniref:hypothetical protein n=2 Tax=Enterococcus faecium TaxID=1352 RepID=UPI0039FD5C6D